MENLNIQGEIINEARALRRVPVRVGIYKHFFITEPEAWRRGSDAQTSLSLIRFFVCVCLFLSQVSSRSRL